MRAFRSNERKEFIEAYYEHGWVARESVNNMTTQLYQIQEIDFNKDETYLKVKINNTFYLVGELYKKFTFFDPSSNTQTQIGVEV